MKSSMLRRTPMRQRSLWLAGLCAGLGASAAARSESPGDEGLAEVVITARLQPEPLREVPLSVAVVGRSMLGAGGIDDLLSLAARVPGLYFESMWGGANSAPVLRGQSQPSAAGDNVGVFVDGVYQGNRSAVDVEPLDLERIEVVRGPQNALFGRSTFAGAIHFVSREPGARATNASAEAGSAGYRAAQAGVSFEQAGWRGRVAARVRRLDGNVVNAATDGARLGGWRRGAVSASLASPRDAAAQATLRLRYQRVSQDPPATAALTYLQYNCGSRDPVSGAWSYFCGAVPVPRAFDVSPDLPASTGQVSQATLHVEYSHDDWRLESDTSGYAADTAAFRDLDDSSAGELLGVCTQGVNCTGPAGLLRLLTRTARVNIVSRADDTSREFTQELRLSRTVSGRLHWMAGIVGVSSLAWSHGGLGAQRGTLAAGELLTALLPATPMQVGPTSALNSLLVNDPAVQQVPQNDARTHLFSYAGFGTVDFVPVPRVRLHAEIRYTDEYRDLDSVLSGSQPGFRRAIAPRRFSDWNPRASVEWQPAGGSRWYLSSARGSRSGGINATLGLLPEEQTFRPEHNWTTELGWRGGHGGWQAEATLFYIDWEDTQIIGFSNTPGVTALITRNTAGLATSGLEMTLDWRWRPDMTVHAAYAYARPRLRAGSDDPGSAAFCGVSGASVSSTFCVIGPSRSGGAAAGTLVPWIDGNVPNRTPQHTWQLGLDWRLPVPADTGTWQLRADLSGQDRVYDRSIDGAWFGARTLLDARITRTQGVWSLDLWCRNLADERYVSTLSARGANLYRTTPRPLDLIVGEGRRVGVSVRVNF